VRLDLLVKRALRNASPEERERVLRALKEGRVSEILPELVRLAERDGRPLPLYYVSDRRFEPVEEAEEPVDETEEPAEERYEPAHDWEEAVEDDEYVGQRVVRRFWRRPA